jgi:hypothetical protein
MRVRTWAPKGQTPVIQFHWKQLSMIAGVSAVNVYFRLHEGAIKIKRHALANDCPNSIAELSDTARTRLKSAQRRTTLIAAFWKQAELF